jgi:hypothetical protein
VIYTAEVYEPLHPGVTADSTAHTSDTTELTADGGLLVGALDFTDAEVIAATAPVYGGGYYQPRWPPIIGHGYGVLPELEGDAHGTVGNVGEPLTDDEIVMVLLLAA